MLELLKKLIITILFLLSACGGGGTTGTGVVVVQGRVNDSQGQPIANVTVKVLEQNLVSNTDSQGFYSIEVAQSDEIITLEFSKDQTQSQLNVNLTTAQSGVVVVDLIINKDGNIQQDDNIQDEDKVDRSCNEDLDCSQNQYCYFNDLKCGSSSVTGFCKDKGTGVCPASLEPVCGCDGMPYGNTCEANSQGVSVSSSKECLSTPEPNSCTSNDQCDVGAYCKFEENTCGNGQCEPLPASSNCPSVLDPVCACNGESYANSCEARNAGQSVMHDGEC